MTSYRVDELAARAEVSVDTVRYYQRRGVIDPPARHGRNAVYSPTHLDQLAEARRLAGLGFTLDQIAALRAPGAEAELRQLEMDAARARMITRRELASQAGVPESLISLLVDNGLLQPIEVDAEARFDRSSVTMLQAGLALISAGVPLDRLIGLAATHAHHVNDVVDTAIELFVEHVRPENVLERDTVELVRALLPQVTRLVAAHFHRTLVERSLDRLRGGDNPLLEAALVAADAANLTITCEWTS